MVKQDITAKQKRDLERLMQTVGTEFVPPGIDELGRRTLARALASSDTHLFEFLGTNGWLVDGLILEFHGTLSHVTFVVRDIQRNEQRTNVPLWAVFTDR